MPLLKNQVYTASIEGYTAQGAGVARIDGMAVFVPGTARGDLCRIRLVKVLKNYAFGRVEEILTPSPHRIPVDCAAFPKCGGCTFRHLTYEEELWQKQRRVWDAMRRIGGFDLSEPAIIGSPAVECYRNKAQFPVAQVDGKTVWGFFRSRSHDLIPLQTCAIQDPRACAAADAVCAWADANKVHPYDETTGKGLLRHIYARTGKAGLHLALVVTRQEIPAAEDLIARLRAACPDLCGLVLNVNTRGDNVILGDTCRTLWGDDRLEDDLMDASFRLSPLSFYQVNHAQTQQLYAHAIQCAQLDENTVALDLYCGIGTITLALAKQCKTVIGAEIVPAAIEDAKENAARNGIQNAEFFCGDAGQTAAHLAKEGFAPDVIVCDPPRKGMDEQAIAAIFQMNPKRIVYVSCECETLARDAKLLAQGGYALQHVQAFDMFPRTGHVETVALLRKETCHEMKLQPSPFEIIKSGIKTIELRLFDEKRQQIKPKDKIVFTNTANGETLNTTVVKLHRFDSFEELYKSLPLLACGYTPEDVSKAHPSDMEQYYSIEEQKKYGVVGIELCRSNQITDETVAMLCRADG